MRAGAGGVERGGRAYAEAFAGEEEVVAESEELFVREAQEGRGAKGSVSRSL